MSADPHAAWLWLGIVVLGVIILAAGLLFGSAKWRRAARDARLNRVRDEVTREHYRQE